MSTPRRFRPAHLVAIVLVAAPAYKLAEMAWPSSGRKAVDASSFAAGRDLFNHEWTVNDPLSGGDGIGPVFNARSCLECHNQGGGGGGGPVERNVTVYGLAAPAIGKDSTIPPIGVIHAGAIDPKFQETLNMAHPGLPKSKSMPLAQLVDRTRVTLPVGVTVTQRNTPALFGDGLLDAVPEATLHAEQRRNSELARLTGLSRAKDPQIRGRVARLPDGRLGRFGWKGEFASLDDFVRAACANELGLSNPTRPQVTSLAKRDYQTKGVDLTDAQCVLIGDFLRELPKPEQVMPADAVERAHVENGSKQFEAIGCADCHTPNLGSIEGFYSNLLLHDMGSELASRTGYYGEPPVPPSEGVGPPPPIGNEWRTPPLWGVADSAPYLHDGRAATLDLAITRHAGEAEGVVAKYNNLMASDRDDIIAFLKSLRAPAAPASPGALASAGR